MIVFPGSSLEVKASDPTWSRVPGGPVAGNNLCCEQSVPDPLQFCLILRSLLPHKSLGTHLHLQSASNPCFEDCHAGFTLS